MDELSGSRNQAKKKKKRKEVFSHVAYEFLCCKSIPK
jgi:hypothetical protein